MALLKENCKHVLRIIKGNSQELRWTFAPWVDDIKNLGNIVFTYEEIGVMNGMYKEMSSWVRREVIV